MYYDIFILGCLMEEPHYGYNIKKKLTERFDVCTTINNNTLYSLLKSYEQMEVITKTTEMNEGKPNRNIYSITKKGKRYFVEILRNFPDSLTKNRDEYMMRLYYFHLLDVPTRIKILDMRERYLAAAIASVRSFQDVEDTLFIPKRPELNEFHLRLLQSEQMLISQMREKVNDYCPISDEGEIRDPL